MRRLSSQTRRDLFPFSPCSLSLSSVPPVPQVSVLSIVRIWAVLPMPLPALTLPHCFTCHHSSPSSAWIQRFNECTFLGELFKLTLCFPKRVYLASLLRIILTAGVTLTDSFLWNFYSRFNTSDLMEYNVTLPLLSPLCNHWWKQNSLGRTCLSLSLISQKILCDPYYQMNPALMWKSEYKVYLTNSRVVFWGVFILYIWFNIKI